MRKDAMCTSQLVYKTRWVYKAVTIKIVYDPSYLDSDPRNVLRFSVSSEML